LAAYHIGVVWANCRATLHEVKHNDETKPGRIAKGISYDDFCALPSALVQLWEIECLRLNPHWAPKIPEATEGGSPQPSNTSNEG
jgi:hypothetical protein